MTPPAYRRGMVDEAKQRDLPTSILLDTVGTSKVTLVEESLQVDKVRVDLGGVRVTKRIETREQQVNESLIREKVEVERRAIGQRVDRVPELRQEGDTTIYPIVEEVLYTEKRLMLVEEVRITRLREVEPHSESITLRKEHAEIERLEPAAQVPAST